MSILQRYRKRGGFLKLLQLVETSAPKKQEQLLKVIAAEDAAWAKDISTKMLSFEKFCGWKPDTQFLILDNCTNQYKYVLYKTLPEEVFAKITETMAPHELAPLNDNLLATKDPLDGEVLSAKSHLLEVIRSLNEDNAIILSQIDPHLALPEAA